MPFWIFLEDQTGLPGRQPGLAALLALNCPNDPVMAFDIRQSLQPRSAFRTIIIIARSGLRGRVGDADRAR